MDWMLTEGRRRGGKPDEFGRLLRRATLRRITLHESRHTTLTLMEHAGVPISIISKWAGHYDSAFTQRTYVHASDDDLRQGRAASRRFTRSPSNCEKLRDDRPSDSNPGPRSQLRTRP
jgi:integrase